MYKFILFLIFTCSILLTKAQTVTKGKVISTDGTALAGATVFIVETKKLLHTDVNGNFSITLNSGKFTFKTEVVGYQPKSIQVVLPQQKTIVITLEHSTEALQEVLISSGYQEISADRSTGSYTKIDHQLLNRKVSTDILSRLEDVVPGLILNRGKSANGSNDISIRGQNTLFAKASPLIVIDNFPYEGDLNTINPNDVESISILKDAAAASIWGARAGNGVVIITTKKGKFKQKPMISFNTNLTIGEKPDLFYYDRISSADYIELEKTLFDNKYYQSAENSANKPPLSPVVELLIAKREKPILKDAIDQQIESLKNNDIRNDYNQYLYRTSLNQQNSLSISGGSPNQKYYVSAGYDKNSQALRGNSFDRISLNASNSYLMFNSKLEITSSIVYTGSKTIQNNTGTSSITYGGNLIYPYAQLADEQGNSLAIEKDYRKSFTEDASVKGLLNWDYRPLGELMFTDNTSQLNDYRINTNVKIQILPGLKGAILYQYGQQNSESRNLQSQDTYYTRDQINRLSILNEDGTIERPIPLGGILDFGNRKLISNNLRLQMDYASSWKGKHELNAIAGFEVQDLHTFYRAYRYYGYDAEHATSRPVDYVKTFTSYINPSSKNNVITNKDALSDLTDRNRSYYINASYSYLNRYVFSSSARLDQSNLFGVKTNQKGVPLWSAGLAWVIDQEPFFQLDWLPRLKLRASFGYNGNINKNVSAYTTARLAFSTSALTKLPYANIINPPNPELRWERVKIINTGLDFELKNNRLSGSFEFFLKKGLDLIGSTPFPGSTGIRSFTGNTASTSGNGFELNLNSINLNGQLKWNTNLLMSHVKDKVTDYKVNASTDSYMQFGDGGAGAYPLQGKPLFAIYSYQWAGLDPENGDPMGYMDGSVSKNWAGIISSATPENILYHGPARPEWFGAIRNTFSYRNFTVSANISYRLNYFYRKTSIIYNNNMGLINGHGDYAQRWQHTADEQQTNVPSIPLTTNANRDKFYTYSSALVEKGDHIRLQDINLSYDISKRNFNKLPVQNIQLYLYANNLGILWKASNKDMDPDYVIYTPAPSKTIAIGVKVNL